MTICNSVCISRVVAYDNVYKAPVMVTGTEQAALNQELPFSRFSHPYNYCCDYPAPTHPCHPADVFCLLRVPERARLN